MKVIAVTGQIAGLTGPGSGPGYPSTQVLTSLVVIVTRNRVTYSMPVRCKKVRHGKGPNHNPNPNSNHTLISNPTLTQKLTLT